MKFEDLSPEDQKLLNTDFGDLDKEASARVEVAQEMYGQGQSMAENIANALVDTQYTQEGIKLWVGVRKRRLEARVAKLPFYKREGK